MEPTQVQPGKYTLIECNGLAMTQKTEFELTGYNEVGNAIIKIRGKRGKFHRIIKPEKILLFEGWDLPIKVDMEFSRFSGNACINLVADSIERVRIWIDEKAALPVSNDTKGRVTFTSINDMMTGGFDEPRQVVVYPEIEIQHAVIDRLKRANKIG